MQSAIFSLSWKRGVLVGVGALTLIAAPVHAQTVPPATGDPATAQAAMNPPPLPGNPDPWEGMNRKFYSFSRGLDHYVLRPLAMGYKTITPHVLRVGIRNVFNNMDEPVVFVNDTLQLRLGDASKTAGRFVVNSTVGIGGLFDVAQHIDLPHHDNDFGLTLGRYGTPAGPYIFIPIGAPSSVRDLTGMGVDAVLSPWTWIRYPGSGYVNGAKVVLQGLDKRIEAEPQLKALDNMATDPYATLRSLYLQSREAKIHGGAGVDIESLPAFDDPGEIPSDAPMVEPQAAPGEPQTEAAPEPAPEPVPAPQ